MKIQDLIGKSVYVEIDQLAPYLHVSISGTLRGPNPDGRFVVGGNGSHICFDPANVSNICGNDEEWHIDVASNIGVYPSVYPSRTDYALAYAAALLQKRSTP
jgi:hypothetical protein